MKAWSSLKMRERKQDKSYKGHSTPFLCVVSAIPRKRERELRGGEEKERKRGKKERKERKKEEEEKKREERKRNKKLCLAFNLILLFLGVLSKVSPCKFKLHYHV